MAADTLSGPGGDEGARRAVSGGPAGRYLRRLFLASEGAEFTTGTIIDVNGASYLRT